ncbi:MAG: hypothetical protein UW28_C0030G0015 [Parcubacteria group bacterium GW2011_GWA2_44_13]|nr:MAG: hypothetical protein UW28_C0030G0015 [Parcubacteria group bacterium GW2011_GWA2_44_13]
MEKAAKNPENEGDFPKGINTDELNEDDMAMWRKIRGKSIEMGDIDEYKKNFAKENGFESESRYNFLMFMANKANVIIGRREVQK